MKTTEILTIENQVQDLVDLSNLLLNTNYVRYYDIQKDFPKIDKMLKKLNQFERHFLLERIEASR